MTPGMTKVVRGLCAAGTATWVALFMHLAGGGQMPAAPGIVIPFIFAWCACTALAGWSTDSVRLTLSVGVSQLLFHSLFSLGAGVAPAGAPHHVGAAPHHADATLPPAGGLSAPATHAMHGGALMTSAHIAAAILTIIALVHGERALLRLRDHLRLLTGRALVLPTASTTVLPQPVTRPTWSTPVTRCSLGHFGLTVSRRGPPPLHAS